MLTSFRQFTLRSPWHTSAVYGLSISAAIFLVLVGFRNGFDVAIRTALVALVIGGFVSFAVVTSLTATVVATLAFVLIAGLASYLGLRSQRYRY
jgi:lysylphosphatidylglycerol synthetase-like protein (DUF2156 family)